MRRPAGILLAALSGLLVIALLALRLLLADEPARRDGASAGLIAVLLAVATSFLLLRRALPGAHLGFLRAYFMGLLLRVLLLATIGFAVWGATDWDLRAFLVAVALSYPFALALEGWQLSREALGREPGKTGARP